MDSDQQQQKGLFTFYRQQADLQDELMSQKKILKVSKLDRIEESLKKSLSHAHKMKNGHKRNLHSFSGENQSVQSFQKGLKDASLKSSQTKDKLITILRKYNVKQLKRRDHLRIIMEMQEEPSQDQTEQLKNRLQKLLSEERDDYFKLIQSQRITNHQSLKQQQFTKKREEFQRINPFHRLAIIPTNFTTQLQQQKDSKLPLKKVHSPPKSLIYSLQVRKNDRLQANMQPKQRYQGKISQMLANQPLKLFLPKIDARSNSQMINKSKIRPSKLGQKYYIDPIRSQRFKNKSQLSIFLQSIQPVNVGKNSQHIQNKIHSLFIEHKDGQRIQQAKSTGKEIKLADVIKRMNFS